jgi:hypothetical protein
MDLRYAGDEVAGREEGIGSVMPFPGALVGLARAARYG